MVQEYNADVINSVCGRCPIVPLLFCIIVFSAGMYSLSCGLLSGNLLHQTDLLYISLLFCRIVVAGGQSLGILGNS